MEADRLFLRCAMVIHETSDEAPLHLARKGDSLVLLARTPGRAHQRAGVWGRGLASTLTRTAPTLSSGCARAVSAAGSLIHAAGWRPPQPKPLLEIDVPNDSITVPGTGATIRLSEVASLRGVCNTQNGRPETAVAAVLKNGSAETIMAYPGHDGRQAELTCRMLGYLLDVPSDYASLIGGFSTCHVLDSTPALLRLGDLSSANTPPVQPSPVEQGVEDWSARLAASLAFSSDGRSGRD